MYPHVEIGESRDAFQRIQNGLLKVKKILEENWE
jgi:hypothetical protein